MRKFHPLFWAIILVIILVLAVCSIYDLNFLNTTRFLQNIKIVSTYFLGVLPLMVLVGFFLLLMTNKWAFKIEKLSLGGFNLMFDNPAKLYKRAVRSFLDTKRSLFKIDFERDNFDETLTSYYKTYEFFREEMKILENEKKRGRWSNKGEQQELYKVTNEILQVLHEFLTSHQNNYRRWYKRVADTDTVATPEGGLELRFHMTPISEVQKHYYRYLEMCEGFNRVNQFFKSTVEDTFEVSTEKWERI
ncbi:hypothetical protein UY416_02765 [Paenibacillus polymyxa]|uniref:hypothetical protein n=1 Tax=Paenibacillus polymyxa TaxID=1406 RepID=UPI002AB579AA|nr:hypothetical protein [Paenibacillus polymyxa]MDY8045213.1 hypothetical protein [Paenibacillus polymyxa]